MKEDYCGFEISKLLEEKGFDEYCRAEWLEYIGGSSKGKTYLTECGRGLQHDSCSNTSLKKFNYDGQMFYAAPTLQMAMKWLREVHNIFIQIELYSKNNDYCFELFQNTHRLMVEKREVYNSYESACESAIKYCLTNLI